MVREKGKEIVARNRRGTKGGRDRDEIVITVENENRNSQTRRKIPRATARLRFIVRRKEKN
jgi:hypothetical protein